MAFFLLALFHPCDWRTLTCAHSDRVDARSATRDLHGARDKSGRPRRGAAEDQEALHPALAREGREHARPVQRHRSRGGQRLWAREYYWEVSARLGCHGLCAGAFICCITGRTSCLFLCHHVWKALRVSDWVSSQDVPEVVRGTVNAIVQWVANRRIEAGGFWGMNTPSECTRAGTYFYGSRMHPPGRRNLYLSLF